MSSDINSFDAAPSMRSTRAKIAHLDACLLESVEYRKSAGFERWDFINQAAVDISLSAIDISTTFIGKNLTAPLMIAPMTGGITRGAELNRRWALAAQHFGIAMGVGSQRIALENPSRSPYYEIRKYAPSIPLFANLGAAQLCRGYGPTEALAAVEMIGADGIFIHLNAIQEACQGSEVHFDGLLRQISALCEILDKHHVPVFVREVCFGLSSAAARRLIDVGVSGLDCSGAGGTSWAKVEAACAQSENARALALSFGEWGIPTAESIVNVRKVCSKIPLVASGGIRSGIDVAKSLALGANIAAIARPILLAAVESEEKLHAYIERILAQLRICMLGTGTHTIAELRQGQQLTDVFK